MKQFLRWLLLFLLLALLSAVGAGIWIIKNEAKVEDAVLKSIASHLITDAQIGEATLDIFSDFPHISLRLDQVAIPGSSGQPSDTLLQADYLQLHCNALQLFRGNYQIESASIENGLISVISNASGQWNTKVWESEATNADNEANFAFRELNITNCSFHIDGTSFDIPHMRIQGGWNNSLLEATIEGGLDELKFEGLAETLPSAELNCSAQWSEETHEFSAALDRVHLWGGDWKATAHYSEDGGWNSAGEFKRISLQAILPWMSLPEILESLNSKALVSGKFNWAKEELRTQITLPMSDWKMDYIGLNQPILGQAQASVWTKYANQKWRIDIPKWILKVPGIYVSGSLNNFNPASGSFASSPIDAEVTFEKIGSLRNLWGAEGLALNQGDLIAKGSLARDTQSQLSTDINWELKECAGDHERTPWEFNGTGRVTNQSLSIQESRTRWGDQFFTTTASLFNPMSWHPGQPIQGEVNIQLDSWTYEETDEDPIALTQLVLPTDSRIGWSVQCDKAYFSKWTLENIEAEGKLEPLLWTLHRFRCETLGGQLNGDGQALFVPKEDRASIQINPVASQINLPALFEAFDDFQQSTLRAEHLQGALSASGSLQFECRQSLSWDSDTFEMLGEASIENGVLKQVEAFDNIANYLKENRMIAPLVDPEDLAQRLEDVTFERLESPLYVADQAVHLPEIQIRSSAMNISLVGSYDFEGTLDYTLGFSMRDLRQRGEGKFGPIEDDGLGQQFFIQMDGNVNNPNYSWDRKAQRDHRKNNFQREKELLKSLFKRS